MCLSDIIKLKWICNGLIWVLNHRSKYSFQEEIKIWKCGQGTGNPEKGICVDLLPGLEEKRSVQGDCFFVATIESEYSRDILIIKKKQRWESFER